MQLQQNKKAVVGILITIAALLVGIVYSYYMAPSLQSHRRFGVTYMTMNNPFYEVINNEMKKEIEARGDELITLDPALDIEKQKEQIYSFIDQGVDGIFVNPIDSQKIESALLAAQEAGIPIIIIDAPIYDENLAVSSITSDNYDAGVQCAKNMMARKEHANIVLLKHTAVKSAKDRIDGFLDTIAGNENYHVINERECEGQLELAMPMMQQMIKENDDFDVVMALNDPSALGALAALESLNKQDVIVYGVDGTPDMKSLINKSDMVAGTVAQSPIQFGKISAKTMYDYLSNKKIKKDNIIPVTLIYSSNIDQYDETGWQ